MRVLVLPGLDGTGVLLKDFAVELQASFDVEIIAYPTHLATYDDLLEWLQPHLPQQDYVIVAESFSGPLALKLAARKPSFLKGVVFAATFARRPRSVPAFLIGLGNYVPMPTALLAFVSRPFVLGASPSSALIALYRTALEKVPYRTLIERLTSVLTIDVRSEFGKVDAPCIYLQASRDWLVPTSAALDFASITGLPIRFDAPHFLLQCRPMETAEETIKFLKVLTGTKRKRAETGPLP